MTTRNFVPTGNVTASNTIDLVERSVDPISIGGGTTRATANAIFTKFVPVGGLTDFGQWTTGQPDSAMTRSFDSSATLVDSVLVRPWLSANRPHRYLYNDTGDDTTSSFLWDNARFAGVGTKWAGVTNNSQHTVDGWMFESAETQTNSLGFDAATLEGSIFPFVGSSAAPTVVVSRSTDRAYFGRHSIKVTVGTAVASSTVYPIPYTGFAYVGDLVAAVPGQYMSASARVSSDVATRQFRTAIVFYDITGAVVAGGAFGSAVTHPGDGSWILCPVIPTTAPVGTVWAAMLIQMTSTAGVGEVWYADAPKVIGRAMAPAVGGNLAPSAYVPARQVKITALGDRVNYVPNPISSSLTSTTNPVGLALNAGITSATDSTVMAPLLFNGGYSLKVTIPYVAPSGGGINQWGVESESAYGSTGNSYVIAGLRPGRSYVASAWVKTAAGCPPVRTSVGNFVQGVQGTVYATGHSTADIQANHAGDPAFVNSDIYRVYTTFSINSGDTGEIDLRFYILDGEQTVGVANAIFYIAGLQVEAGTTPTPFFDGNQPGYDYVWEGTAYKSRSHNYQGKREKAYRLGALLPDALPVGVPYTISYAPPLEGFTDVSGIAGPVSTITPIVVTGTVNLPPGTGVVRGPVNLGTITTPTRPGGPIMNKFT